MSSEKRKAQTLFGIGIFILVACTFSTLQENSNRTQPVPKEIQNIQKMTPVLYVSSSIAPEIQSPKIILKPKTEDNKESNKILETKMTDDQKRLEPPVPQEPEVKVDQNADLDPQALQKEDKELQKDANHISPNIDTAKKDEDLAKQEKLLKKLEEQQVEHKLLLEEQKKVLEQLKQHKESHEEMKKNDVVEKQEISKNNEVTSSVKQNIIDAENLKKSSEPVKKPPSIEETPLVKSDIQPEADEKKNKYDVPSVPLRNISNNIPIDQNVEILKKKNKLENTNLNVLVKKPVVVSQNKPNETLLDHSKKREKQNTKQNISIISQEEAVVVNIQPNSKIDTVKVGIPESDKNSEMHVKHRETLAKKVELEMTVSLPKQDINVNGKGQT